MLLHLSRMESTPWLFSPFNNHLNDSFQFSILVLLSKAHNVQGSHQYVHVKHTPSFPSECRFTEEHNLQGTDQDV